jgi:hypothetical protein
MSGAMRARWIGLALAAFATYAGPAAGATLCNSDERIVFSCSAGSRIASICASSDLSKTQGSIQYRFGRPGRLELVYPEAATAPGEAFQAGMLMFSGGGGAWLRFRRGLVDYTIFSATGKWGPGGASRDVAGVAVRNQGKNLAGVACGKGLPEGDFGPDFFDQIGLKISEDSDEFEIPNAFMPK